MSNKTETTIHDIARKLNISASTVSRALNDNPIISKNTRKLIKKTAEEMGYRPNFIAANFRTKKTNTIGVIVPLINRHFFSSVISGIEDVAYEQGFAVTISQSNDNFEKESKIAQSLFASRVDGIILSIGMQTRSYEHLKLFSERNIPLVFFDRIVDEIEAHKIVGDDFGSSYKGTKHLIEQGAKTLAHIGGPLNLQIYHNRQEGFKQAVLDSGLEFNPDLVLNNSLTRQDGIRAIQSLRNTNKNIDAIFCANDTSALSVIMELKKAGMSVPEDMLVMGFSNEPFSELISPSLSTVKQPGFSMGKTACKLLLSQIKSGNDAGLKYETITLPYELIVRESTQKK